MLLVDEDAYQPFGAMHPLLVTTPNDPTPVSEVVVTAPTSDGNGNLGGNYNFEGFHVTSPPPSNPAGTSAFNIASNAAFTYMVRHVEITADLSNSKDEEAWTRVYGAIWDDIFNAKYASLQTASPQSFTSPLGEQISVRDYLGQMENINWLISDNVQGGVAGITSYPNGANGIRQIDLSLTAMYTPDPLGNDYDKINPGGDEYVVNHEIGHALNDGVSVYQTELNDYKARTNDQTGNWTPTDPEFIANESMANSLGKAVSDYNSSGWLPPNVTPGNNYWTGYKT